jgi:hypothetical protein
LGGAVRAYDPDLAKCSALVIDAIRPRAHPGGAFRISDRHHRPCGRVQEARRQLEAREFDIVLCEQDFHGEYSGQDLLNDLRRASSSRFSTVFVMVTAEASYAPSRRPRNRRSTATC